MTAANLTERQKKWFASVQAGLERDSGKTLAEWVEIAKTCPEHGHKARLRWFKDEHGLLQNRASQVLNAAFGTSMAWDDPDTLVAALWREPQSRAIFDAIQQAALSLPSAIQTARRGYTAWSRRVQFAALRPLKGRGAMLGVAIAPSEDNPLTPPRSESWSERLKGRVALATPAAVDARIVELLRQSWEGA